MGRIAKSLVALVTGAALVFIYTTSSGADHKLPSFSAQNYGTQLGVYAPPAKQKEKKPVQTAYFNLKGAFGIPYKGLENLTEYYNT